MDTLIQEYNDSLNGFMLNHNLISLCSGQNLAESCRTDKNGDFPEFSNSSVLPGTTPSSSEENHPEETDYSDEVLKFISQMLMEEEDLEHKPCMYHDCMALQATEKSFYDALNAHKSENSFNGGGNQEKMNHGFDRNCSSQSSSGSFDSGLIYSQRDLEFSVLPDHHSFFGLNQFPDSFSSRNFQQDYDFRVVYDLERDKQASKESAGGEELAKKHSPESSARKKHKRGDNQDTDFAEANRRRKLQIYDKVLIGSNSDPDSDEELLMCTSPKAPSNDVLQQSEQSKGGPKRRRPRGGKKQDIIKEVVDLRSLLMQCAQAVASYDSRTADELIKRIRQHSSASGDASERLAHYFVNALEARMAGTGTALYTTFDLNKISAAEILKAYHVYVTASPFRRMSHVFANKCIKNAAVGAAKLHIIDFGILYGFQWPCLIQLLSERPGGPPKLRITGIEFPQTGSQPAQRVEDTGRRLAKYCKRFNVPFEYNAIAKNWDTIQLQDLQIDEDEVLAVNCLFRLKNVPDETVLTSSPRDVVLKLIKNINPDIFVHGVHNGTYNSPFFVTRFREAVFHYSSLFDMFEATLPQEDQQRMLFEKEVFGRDAMNVIACEGTERVERPETYRQWQVRNLRAGFRQLPLDPDIVKYIRDKVKRSYHKDFIVDEDGKWILQGWKGKVIYSLSCWKPAHKQQK